MKNIALIYIFTAEHCKSHIHMETIYEEAMWSRHSFLTFSDAEDMNVPIYYYVEETLKGKTPFSEADTIYFEAPPLHNTLEGEWGRLGKQLVSMWDKQFAETDLIIKWDADTYHPPQKSDIFSRIRNREFTSHAFSHVTKTEDDIIAFGNKVIAPGYSFSEWATKAGVTDIIKKNHLRMGNGHFGVYPAKLFHNEQQKFIDWIETYGKHFGNDDRLLGLTEHKFGLQMLSLEKEIKLNTYKVNNFKSDPPEMPYIIHGRNYKRFEIPDLLYKKRLGKC